MNAQEVLDKVVSLPLLTYNLKSQDPSIRHIGPMAQDFKAAFGYGGSDTHITSTDADGVALAAIQGLNEKLEDTRGELVKVREEKQAEIDSLKKEFTERFASLEKRFLAMEASMN